MDILKGEHMDRLKISSFFMRKWLSGLLEKILFKKLKREIALDISSLEIQSGDDQTTISVQAEMIVQTMDIQNLLSKLSKMGC